MFLSECNGYRKMTSSVFLLVQYLLFIHYAFQAATGQDFTEKVGMSVNVQPNQAKWLLSPDVETLPCKKGTPLTEKVKT